MSTHEDFSRKEDIRAMSDQSFGLVFAAFFTVVALLPLLHRRQVRWWALVLGGVLLLMTLTVPSLLHALNQLWTRLGLLLNGILNRIITALLFYAVVTPTGLLMRFFGNDLLRLRLDSRADTYWIERKPPGPTAESMSKQF